MHTYVQLPYTGNFAVGYQYNDLRFDSDFIPQPFKDGEYLDEAVMPAYSAFSQGNIKSTDLDPGRIPEDYKQVIFINYGRQEDYEDLFSKSNNKITRANIKDDVVIAR